MPTQVNDLLDKKYLRPGMPCNFAIDAGSSFIIYWGVFVGKGDKEARPLIDNLIQEGVDMGDPSEIWVFRATNQERNRNSDVALLMTVQEKNLGWAMPGGHEATS